MAQEKKKPAKKALPAHLITWPKCKKCKSDKTTGHGVAEDGSVLPGQPVFCKCLEKKCGHEFQICGAIVPHNDGKKHHCGRTNLWKEGEQAPHRGKNCGHGGSPENPPGRPVTTGGQLDSKFRKHLKGALAAAWDECALDPNVTSLIEDILLIRSEKLQLVIEREQHPVDSQKYFQLSIRIRNLDDKLKSLAETENRRQAFEASNLNQRQFIDFVKVSGVETLKDLEEIALGAIQRGMKKEDLDWLISQFRMRLYVRIKRYAKEMAGAAVATRELVLQGP